MSTPFVCKVCGQAIKLGRHQSGWRHVSGTRSDHRVQKIARDDYIAASSHQGIVFVLAQDDLGLDVFASEQAAMTYCEGIDVKADNYLFWDFAGRPLRPVFPAQGRVASFIAPSDKYYLEPESNDGDLLVQVLDRAVYLDTNKLFESFEEIRAYLESL